METARLAARDDYYDDGTSYNYTTVIVVVVVILILKICLIAGLCYYRSKKRKQRAARGCTCFNDTDYYCLPWWYWSSDSRCHCGALNNTAYNAPPAYNSGPAYSPAPAYAAAASYPPSGYSQQPYNSVPQAEAGQWNAQQQGVPMKPADNVYSNGRYY